MRNACIEPTRLLRDNSLPATSVIRFVRAPISFGRLPTMLFSSISSHLNFVRAPT